MHYYQHHIGDFIKATSRLTDTQTMTYLRMLWMYYDSEKPIKNDLRTLAFQLAVSENDVDLILSSFFKLDGDQWLHSRCDQEIAEYRSFIEKKSRGGKASAQQRLNSSSAVDEQALNSCSTDVQLTNNHKPITNIKDIRPEDVDISIWKDFVSHRKAKKSPITETVLKTIRTEADKAGWKMQDALTEMCSRGWTGFKSDWVKGKVEVVPEWKLRIK